MVWDHARNTNQAASFEYGFSRCSPPGVWDSDHDEMPLTEARFHTAVRPNDYRLGTPTIAALRLGVPYEVTSSALTILIGLHSAVLQQILLPKRIMPCSFTAR